MKIAVVTGANGFIGSKLVCKLIEKDYLVYAIIKDNQENISHIKNLKNVKIVYCSLDEINKLPQLIKEEVIDTFFHLAWAGVSTTFKNNFEIQYKNVEYTYAAICAAKAINAKKFVSTGSASECAYSEETITGDNIPNPSDIYSVSKISARYYSMIYAKQNNMNFNWCLITSLYGPGRKDNNILTYAITSLLQNKSPDFTKLEQIWNYIYIDDLINALYLIGEKGKNMETYAIGSYENKKLSSYIETIAEIINPDIKLNIGAIQYKTNRIDNSIIDIKKLHDDTGFEPQTDFNKGIRKTIDYYRKEMN